MVKRRRLEEGLQELVIGDGRVAGHRLEKRKQNLGMVRRKILYMS